MPSTCNVIGYLYSALSISMASVSNRSTLLKLILQETISGILETHLNGLVPVISWSNRLERFGYFYSLFIDMVYHSLKSNFSKKNENRVCSELIGLRPRPSLCMLSLSSALTLWIVLEDGQSGPIPNPLDCIED